MIENGNNNQLQAVSGIETLKVSRKKFIFNALTFAISKKNLSAAKFFIEEKKVNLAEMFRIQMHD
jgi:hypothetical protein